MYLANANADFRVLTAFRGDDGAVQFAQLPVFGFSVENGAVVDVVSVESPAQDEVRALVDLRSGHWWDGPFASGETLETCKAYLVELCQELAPAAAGLARAAVAA